MALITLALLVGAAELLSNSSHPNHCPVTSVVGLLLVSEVVLCWSYVSYYHLLELPALCSDICEFSCHCQTQGSTHCYLVGLISPNCTGSLPYILLVCFVSQFYRIDKGFNDRFCECSVNLKAEYLLFSFTRTQYSLLWIIPAMNINPNLHQAVWVWYNSLEQSCWIQCQSATVVKCIGFISLMCCPL